MSDDLIRQDEHSLRNAILDQMQFTFWFRMTKHLSKWFPDICAEENRHRVLVIYSGNNQNVSETWLNTPELAEKLITILTDIIPQYGYEAVVFDRDSEALHDELLDTLNYVTTQINSRFKDVKLMLTTSTYNARDFQHRAPLCKLVGIAGFFLHVFPPADLAHITYQDKPREKTYLNLNRIPKIARLYVLGKLREQGLFDHGAHSFSFISDEGHVDRHMEDYVGTNETVTQYYECQKLYRNDCGPIKGMSDEAYWMYNECERVINEQVIQSGLCNHNLVLDRDDVMAANPSNHDLDEFYLFDRARISLINETHNNIWFGTPELDGGVFISEKTAKAVIFRHPFLMFGAPGHLREMRNMGFKTFSDVWDESYDNIINPIDRVDAIMSVLTEICSWDEDHWHAKHPELESIVNHNFFAYINKRIKLANLDEPLNLL